MSWVRPANVTTGPVSLHKTRKGGGESKVNPPDRAYYRMVEDVGAEGGLRGYWTTPAQAVDLLIAWGHRVDDLPGDDVGNKKEDGR